MQALTDFINELSSFFGMILIIPLIGTGVFLTLKMRFIQMRKLKHSWEIIRGVYDDPQDAGDITHFQALSAALSATIGIGNIAGVATAIHYGGPGALFWMWVTAFFGMCTKYVECSLSQKYRNINPDGSASGGPMYYIEKGLGTGWKPLAVIFAVCAALCSFGTGNMVQSFTVADSFRTEFGIGGIKRIGQVASKLVPFMSALYIIAAVTILVMHLPKVPEAIGMIFEHAFTPLAGVGGFAGATMFYTLNWGVRRGLFSNEAGQGSAPIAHAAAKTGEPIREGAVAMVGPLLDTLIICTMTGLVILTGAWNGKEMTNKPLSDIEILQPGSEYVQNTELDGERYVGEFRVEYGVAKGVQLAANHGLIDGGLIGETQSDPFSGRVAVDSSGVITILEDEYTTADLLVFGEMRQNGSLLTSFAFSKGLGGEWGSWLVTIGVFLFAISTMISWSYYGDRSVQYLWGDKAVLPYKCVYVLFNFLGSILALEVVWGLGDVALSLMSFPNLLALIILAAKVAGWQKDYFSREHKRFK